MSDITGRRPNQQPTRLAVAPRRAFLRGLLALPLLSAMSSAWWLRSSGGVIVRGGWVLSEND